MAVYVDDFYKTGATFRGMKMSHLIADSNKELIEFVRKIGVSPRWIQDVGTPREHFDVCKVKRQKAISAGAIEIGFRELAEKTKTRKYG